MDSEADQEASLTKVQDKLEHLSKRVGELSELIDKITQEFLEDHLTKSDQIERAKVYHVLAFIINALSFAYIKICGKSVESHPVIQEIERLKRYYIRLYDSGKGDGKASKRVDSRVASNMIKHSLSGEKEFAGEIKKARSEKRDGLKDKDIRARREASRILDEIKHSLG